MAVVSRITTIQLSAALGNRTFRATAAVQDTAHGQSVTITITNSPTGTVPPAAADTLTLRVRIDNSATDIVSFTLTPNVATQDVTFYFTDTGASGGTARCGTVRMRLEAVRTSGTLADNYTVNSDDTTGEVLPAGTTVAVRDQGWIRGTTTLTEAISNVALGGAKSTPAAYTTAGGDSLFVRTTSGAISYTARALTVAVSSTTPALSAATNSTTAVQRDVTFSNVVDNRFPAASTVVGVSITVPNAGLTGSPDWTNTSTTDDTITVDPRLNGAAPVGTPPGSILFHTQSGGSQFFDPPSSGDVPAGQRVFPDVAYLSVRYTNSRGEGVNGLGVTLKLWDVDNVTGSESVPTHTFSGTTATRPDAPPTPVTPEAGWLPLAASGTDEDTLPLTWSTVAAGTWRVKSVVTTPSDATGLQVYALSSGADTWNRNVFFITVNPNLSPVISIHPENITHHGSHLTPEDNLIPVVYLIDHSDHRLVDLVESNGDSVHILIVREHHPTMRFDYFDFITEAWVGKANGAAIPTDGTLELIRGDAHGSSLGTGDPDIWTTATHLGGDIFAPDGLAGELDCMIVADITHNGVHYLAFAPVILVGTGNKHNSYSLDPIALALSGRISFR